MRNLYELNRYRLTSPEIIARFQSVGDDKCGVFSVPYDPESVALRVIASAGGGWDHVSVSLPYRCPTWNEMEHVKRLFFADDETAMQLHVPVSDHINLHPYCLHLWLPHDFKVPRPPAYMVG